MPALAKRRENSLVEVEASASDSPAECRSITSISRLILYWGITMKNFAAFVFLLVMPILAFAVAPSFSGTWIRDIGQSDAMATNIDGKVVPISADLVIKHEGSDLQIESRWDYKPPTTTTYVLSGTENSRSDERGNSITYTTSWDQDRLVIDELARTNTPFGRAEVKTRSVWSLSNGGNTLTILTTSNDLSRKQIYHR